MSKQPSLFDPVAPARRSSPTQQAGAKAAAPGVRTQCRAILDRLADLRHNDDMTQREIGELTALPINVVSARVHAMENADHGRPFMLATGPLVRCTQHRHHPFSTVAVKAYRITQAGREWLNQ